MAPLIVIEGLDGAGKSTQVDLLKQHLEGHGISYHFIHFPRVDCEPFGPQIARFLRGEFGAVNDVDPYLVAMLYASDRKDADPMIRGWLAEGHLVLLDRYYHSNIAFQCAKLSDPARKAAFQEWVLRLERDYYQIAQPSLTLYLDTPVEWVERRLESNRAGADRRYLNGAQDIHENSPGLQKRVAEEYRRLARTEEELVAVSCVGPEGDMASPEQIHRQLLAMLGERGLLGA